MKCGDWRKQIYWLLVLNFVKFSFQYRRIFVIIVFFLISIWFLQMWRLTREMLPLTLSNCLHFVSFGLCWEFDLGLRVGILDRKSIFIGETLICSTTIAILFRTHRFSPKFWHFPNAANLTVAINSFSFLLISCSSISICFLLSTTWREQIVQY